MDFFKSLFSDSRIYFGNKFIFFFLLIFISAILDFFAVVSLLPVIELLFPDTLSQNQNISNFLDNYLNFLNLENNVPLLILLIILIVLSTRIIEYFSLIFTFRISQNIKYKLQTDFIDKLNKCYLSYFINIRDGEIINLYNREILFVAEVYRLFFIILSRILIFIILVPFLFINEFTLTSITSILIISTILIMRKFYKMVEKTATKVINFQKEVSASFTFFIKNIFSIKKSIYETKNSEVIKDQTKNLLGHQLKQINYNLIISSFVEPFFIIFLIISFYLIFKLNNNIPAEFLINMGFLIRFGRHFLSIQSFYLKIINWKRYVISKKFHDDLISEFSYEESTNNKKKIENIENIKIQNLSINYNDEKIIQNFNLTLKNNFFIKIYGDNGSGKTTLARSMLGLIKLNEGQIKYNDIKLNEIDKFSISQKITILDKNPLIIEGSILDNITIGSDNKDIDKKELLNLISLLNLEKLFNENNLQKKIIEENGKNLSQGQIQKISLLRSLMNKYEILIIDEGTSNIDKNDEKKIIDHLFNLYKNKKLNIIFISHSSAYDNMFNQKIILRNEKYD